MNMTCNTYCYFGPKTGRIVKLLAMHAIETEQPFTQDMKPNIYIYIYICPRAAPPHGWSADGSCQQPRFVSGRGLSEAKTPQPPPPPCGPWACGPVAPLVRAICTHRGSRLVTSPVEARHVTGRGLVSPSPPVLGFRFRFYVLGLGFLV